MNALDFLLQVGRRDGCVGAPPRLGFGEVSVVDLRAHSRAAAADGVSAGAEVGCRARDGDRAGGFKRDFVGGDAGHANGAAPPAARMATNVLAAFVMDGWSGRAAGAVDRCSLASSETICRPRGSFRNGMANADG